MPKMGLHDVSQIGADLRGFAFSRAVGCSPRLSASAVSLAFPISAIPAIGAPCAPTPPGLFYFLLQTKALPQIDPCITLAPPLRGPWVTQGRPRPNPKQAEGRGLFSFTRLPNYPFTHSAVRTWQVDPGSDFRVFKEFRATSHPWALPDYSCFLRPNQLRIRTCPWQSTAPYGGQFQTSPGPASSGIRLSVGAEPQAESHQADDQQDNQCR